MILDGKKLKEEILLQHQKEIKDKNLNIKLAIIQVGENEASNIYVRNKEKACRMVGIEVSKYLLDEKVSEQDIKKLIYNLNEDDAITGIILQSPVPEHLDFDEVSGLIRADKDVDGFTKENVYKLYLHKEGILPCTVKGIIALLDKYNIPLDGANVVIIGRGNIVGKPLLLSLMNKNATVTVCHSHTKDISMYTKMADIIICATGVPKLLKRDMVSTKAVVIDVGISKIDGHIVGDVDYDELVDMVKYITPNPGGVGPMTVAEIIDNLIYMEERKRQNG